MEFLVLTMAIRELDGMIQLYIRTIKNFFLALLFFSFISCNSKTYTICCSQYDHSQGLQVLPINKISINKTFNSILGTSNTNPSIQLNNDGKGLIVWDKNAKKINKYIPENETFIIESSSEKSDILVDEKGNGILVWISYFDIKNNLIIKNKEKKLYGIFIKDSKPINHQFIISDTDVETFKGYINEKGNGIIVCRNKDKFTYSYDIEKSKISSYSKSLIDFNKFKIDEIYISDQNNEINLRTFSFKLNTENPILTNLDKYGYGYVSWINKEKSIVLKIVKDYKIYDDREIIVSNNIEGIYKLFLESNGSGILVWDKNKELYIDSIKNYKSIEKEIILSDNKKDILYIDIKINQKGNGIIIWLDNVNNFYLVSGVFLSNKA